MKNNTPLKQGKTCQNTRGGRCCALDPGHLGLHNQTGILWEDNIKIPARVEHFIIKGSISGDHHLWTEYVTSDGKRFGKRDYQLFEIKKTNE